MNENVYDPIVAEVRKNREEWYAEFDCDAGKLREHLISQRPAMVAAGVRYVTEEERQARLAWRRQRQEADERKIASL